MATLPIVNRTRLFLDLLKDGQVESLANYANVDLLDGPTALRIADSIWKNRGPQLYEADGTTPRDPTNAEKSRLVRNVFVAFIANEIDKAKVIPVVKAAEAEQRAIIAAEIVADIGDEEPLDAE